MAIPKPSQKRKVLRKQLNNARIVPKRIIMHQFGADIVFNGYIQGYQSGYAREQSWFGSASI